MTRRYTSNIITLKSGDGSESITIHGDLLRENSPFLKAALDKQYAEDAARDITIPEESMEVVTSYVGWLYIKELSDLLVTPDDKKYPHHVHLIRLYNFAEKIQNDVFCDEVLRLIFGRGKDELERLAATANRWRYTRPIVTINVGSVPTAATTHEDRLCQSSDYFKAALSKDWVEGQKREVNFEDKDVGSVISYIDWLYADRLPEDIPGLINGLFWVELAHLYIFGEYVQDAHFCNAVLSMMIDCIDRTRFPIAAEATKVIYDGTVAGSPLQRFVAYVYAHDAAKQWFMGEQEYPNKFLMNVAAQLAKSRKKDPGTSSYRREQLKWMKEV